MKKQFRKKDEVFLVTVRPYLDEPFHFMYTSWDDALDDFYERADSFCLLEDIDFTEEQMRDGEDEPEDHNDVLYYLVNEKRQEAEFEIKESVQIHLTREALFESVDLIEEAYDLVRELGLGAGPYNVDDLVWAMAELMTSNPFLMATGGGIDYIGWQLDGGLVATLADAEDMGWSPTQDEGAPADWPAMVAIHFEHEDDGMWDMSVPVFTGSVRECLLYVSNHLETNPEGKTARCG